MRFDLVSIFPAALAPPLEMGVVGRARAAGLLDLRLHDLRDFADPPHRHVDDVPYGGGAGMVFRIEPLRRAVDAVRVPGEAAAVVLPSPAGERLTPAVARELAEYGQVVILCDRYEGADERVRALASHEVSLGDYVLTGGELAALVLVDVVARFVPGVVGDAVSVAEDSFEACLLDHGSFTRPPSDRCGDVPAVLLSGDHRRIADWRRRSRLERTLERRPDLLHGALLGAAERELLESMRAFDDAPQLPSGGSGGGAAVEGGR